MSFGGSVSAMISSLKNNARAKRKTYFDKNDSYKKGSDLKTEYDFQEVSADESEHIKERIRANAKKENKKRVFFLILSVMAIIIVFLLFNYY
jgi:hypothetical protein